MAVFFTLFLSAVFRKPFDLFQKSSLLSIAGHEIKVEVADTDEKRNRGLGGRKKLGENEGMIFTFEIPEKYSFWMKDMRFPLDIIWIDERKEIIAISENISPDTYPTSFFPSDPVKYVLEVNASWAKKNRIKIGDSIEL